MPEKLRKLSLNLEFTKCKGLYVAPKCFVQWFNEFDFQT